MSPLDHEVTVSAGLPAALGRELSAWRSEGGFEALAVPWSRLVEASNPGRVDLFRAEVRRGGELVALGIVHRIRSLAVGDYTGGPLERVTGWGRRIGFVPFAFDVAYLELPFTNSSGLLFAPEVDGAARGAIAADVARALHWRVLAADALCVKGRADDAVIGRTLGAEGMSILPFVSSYRLALPGDPPSYEAWLRARSEKYRSNIRRHVRAFDGRATLRTLDDPAPVARRLAELYALTGAKARARGDVPMPMDAGELFYERFREYLGDSGRVRVALVDGAIVAFSAAVFGHDTMFMRFAGLDYEHSAPSRAYFRLFYDGVEEACRRRLRYVDMGSGTGHVKEPLGCACTATRYHVRFQRWLRPVAPVLRRLLDARFAAAASATHSQV